MLDDRNRVSHTYREVTAEEVFESARLLPDILEKAIVSVKQRYNIGSLIFCGVVKEPYTDIEFYIAV
jgi:hypothetical protein